MLNSILTAFNITGADVIPWGSGLINNTWKAVHPNGNYIVQRLNTGIFKNPDAIADNIEAIGAHLLQKEPACIFPFPLKTKAGNALYKDKQGGYYRVMPFIPGSHTIDVLQQPEQAYEAARQFGKFTRLLTGFDVNKLKPTLTDFHNLTLRYKQFEQALTTGNTKRIIECKSYIQELKNYSGIVETYEHIKTNAHFRLRVTHHDTKISNVLFDNAEKGLCVIDLDTVMAGYFISDVGDMMRTYLSPVSEEEKDFTKIEIRPAFFEALAKGYLSEMKDELAEEELTHFIYAGKYMIYMQALRFLTDYINNDVYYGAQYEKHNLVRAGNQIMLLQKLITAESSLVTILTSAC